MTFSATNFYLEWRDRSRRWALRETPGERLLQAVWHHQRLRRDGLRLCDGRTLRVLHPGFWNRESGPDFRQAVLQMEGEPARIGDVEVDLHSSCWRQHKHDRNPAFQNVVLHVVWEGDAPPQAPTLVIKSCLDAPLAELAAWLGTKAAESYPEGLQGRCAAALAKLSSEQRLDLLRQASLARLQRKASDLEARARQVGWEQALWEGLLRALGYKHNVWPMLRLGELRPALQVGQPISLFHWQARLFGVSGLLPTELRRTNAATDHYLRRAWDEWWRERDEFHEFILPVALWRLHGLRPANHPLRRLALVTHWWADGTVPARLEKWFTTVVEDKAMEASLVEVLQAAVDEFWSWHWTLRGRSLARAQPLAGPS
ncbi:MAG: DUF2851 family protein, partial [Verrucomicrobia bacterium]|nr:DUF2851 family protein [Verrucomicrobiota bacterium]